MPISMMVEVTGRRALMRNILSCSLGFEKCVACRYMRINIDRIVKALVQLPMMMHSSWNV